MSDITKEWRALMATLGIVSESWSSRSAYDSNNPFSEIDRIHIVTTRYKDNSQRIEETPRIYSHLMVWCGEVLLDWGWSYFASRTYDIVGPEFTFVHSDLPSIYIKHNGVYPNRFKITWSGIGGGSDEYITIVSKLDWKKRIDSVVEYLIMRSNSMRWKRELKLRQLVS